MKSLHLLYLAVGLWCLCLFPIVAPFSAVLGLLCFVASVLVTDTPERTTNPND